MPHDLKPLARTAVLIACSELKSESLAAGLRALGAEVLVLPVISIRGTADKRALDAALDELNEYAWIIFTSAYGVRFFLNRIEERSIPRDRCKGLQICAVGPATAAALEASGIAVALVPKEYVAEGILAALAEKHGGLQGLAGSRVLMPRAREARDLLPRSLEAAGARVDVVACYENSLPQIDRKTLQSVVTHPPQLLVFTSSSAVYNFISLLGSEDAGRVLGRAAAAALGPITAGALASFGKEAEIVPRENTIASLLDAIRLYYQNLRKEESGVRDRESD